MRYAFVFFIILTVIPLASISMPSALSQSYTTHATTLTTVTEQTFTYAASTPVASYTATSTEAQTMVAGTATQTGISNYYCITSHWSFDAQAGQPVQGAITLSQATSSASISAFILSDQAFTEWQKPANNFCDPTYTGSVTPEWAFGVPQSKQASTVAVNWTPSADGKYWIVAETYSAGTVVVTVNLTSQIAHTVTSISYSTSSTLTALLLTQTLTSVISEPLSQALPTLGGGELLLGAVIVVAIAGIAAYFLLRRKR